MRLLSSSTEPYTFDLRVDIKVIRHLAKLIRKYQIVTIFFAMY